jgi:hypothetical protein
MGEAGLPAPPIRRKGGTLAFAAATVVGSLTALPSGSGEWGAILYAQQLDSPYLSVAPTIVAQPGSEAALPINVVPLEALPQRSFLSVRGLPPTVGLTEGHSVGPGSWAIPLAVLPKARAIIPEGLSTRTEVIFSLIGMDGRLIAQARTTLIIGTAPAAGSVVNPEQGRGPVAVLAPKPAERSEKTLGPVTIPAPKQEPEAGGARASPRASITPEETARAEELIAQGERYLVS